MKMFISSICFVMITTVLLGQSSGDYYRAALKLYESEDYNACLEEVNHAIELSRQGNYYKLRGDCFHKKGEFASALADYDFAETRGCTDLNLFLHRGICRMSLGLYEQGEMDLWRHLEAFPRDAKAKYYLAVGEYMQFNNNKSLEYLNDAVSLDDTFMEAYYLRGANYFEMGKSKLAEMDFAICADLRPEFVRNQLNVAIIYLENLKTQDALDILGNIETSDRETMAEVYFYQGEAYYQLHDEVSACEMWEKSAQLGDSFAARNHQNICVKQNGRHKKRKAIFATF